MKKILSIIIAVASLVSSTAMAAVTAPDGITPAQLSSEVGAITDVLVGGGAIVTTTPNITDGWFVPAEGQQIGRINSTTYVNAVAGKYKLQVYWAEKMWDDREGNMTINGTTVTTVNLQHIKDNGTLARPADRLMRYSQELDIDLVDGVNSIKFDGGNFVANTTQHILGGLRLKLVDPAPTIASISGMEKPCKNETFTLSAVVTDNAALASVTYKIGDGAEVAMTAGADNTYTAPVALTAVGDNVITVTATDAAGQVSTKTHTIECVEFKVSAPTITPITSGENTIYAGSITINNQSSMPITTRVIVAVYDANNVMVGYKSEKYQIGVGTSPTVEASAMVPTAAGYRVEVMAWDSFVTMNELLVTPYGE